MMLREVRCGDTAGLKCERWVYRGAPRLVRQVAAESFAVRWEEGNACFGLRTVSDGENLAGSVCSVKVIHIRYVLKAKSAVAGGETFRLKLACSSNDQRHSCCLLWRVLGSLGWRGAGQSRGSSGMPCR